MTDSRFFIFLLIGGGLGAVSGYFGKCTSGACPFTSTWWRGAIYGTALGFFTYFAIGQAAPAGMDKSTPDVKLVNDSNFNQEVLKSSLPVLVDFYATWCGPCQILSPRLDALASSLTNRVKFVKVNADQSPAIMQEFNIQGLPTLLFFEHGKVVNAIVGLPDPAELKTHLESFAGKGPQTSTANQ